MNIKINTKMPDSVIDRAVAKALVDYDNYSDKRSSAILMRGRAPRTNYRGVMLGITTLAAVSPAGLVIAGALILNDQSTLIEVLRCTGLDCSFF